MARCRSSMFPLWTRLLSIPEIDQPPLGTSVSGSLPGMRGEDVGVTDTDDSNTWAFRHGTCL